MGWIKSRKERKRSAENVIGNDGTVNDVLLRALLNDEPIDRDKAMMLPAVSGAVDFITSAVACMPVRLYRTTKGVVKEVENDPRTKMLNGDTGDTLDGFQLKKAMVEDYLMGKGGYCHIERSRNDVTGLYYVNCNAVGINIDSDPIHKSYDIIVGDGTYKPFEFVKLLRNTKDGASGVGLTVEVAKALETGYQTLLYQLGLVKAGGNKRGFLKSQRKLGQEEIDALKGAWANLYGNSEENVVVLNNGLEFQEASSTSTEMQLNENKRTMAEEINGIFHIKDDFEETYKFAIYPIVRAFETALNRDLLLEREKGNYFFAFDSREIIKASLKERYETYKLAKDCGIMSINEMRRNENMNQIEGLDLIDLGLGSVLFDTTTGETYTPNTGSTKAAGISDSEGARIVQGGEVGTGDAQNRAEPKPIAVDYDETIAHNGYPKPEVVDKLKALQQDGHKVMLWTARTGKDRQDAIDRCKQAGLTFDGVLEGKPDADMSIDGKSVTVGDIIDDGGEVNAD